MKTDTPNQQTPPKAIDEQVLPANELKRPTDFFSVLIEIDQRENVRKMYEKTNK